MRNSKARRKLVRGYLPRYPGPSRYVSQEHIIGGTVAAAIIIATLLVAQSWRTIPVVSPDSSQNAIKALEDEINRLADLLQDNIDVMKTLEERITSLQEEYTRTRDEVQEELDDLVRELGYSSDYVWDLEKKIVSLENKIASLEKKVAFLPDELQNPEKPTWDYVALGLSLAQEETYVDYYADYVEEDLNVTVRLHDWREVGFRCSEFLGQLLEDQELRDIISEAEIITIGGIDGFWPDELVDAVWDNDTERAMEILPSMKIDIDAILDEILTLRSVNNTIIRVNNCYNGDIDVQKELGTFHIVKLIIDDLYGHIVAASLERNIPVVMTYQALNGPDGEEMLPEEFQTTALGFTYLNEAGHTFVAGLYRELGYNPLGL